MLLKDASSSINILKGPPPPYLDHGGNPDFEVAEDVLEQVDAAELPPVLQATPAPASVEAGAGDSWGGPPTPTTLAETGIDLADLLNLMTKALYAGSTDTIAKLADLMKLPSRLVAMLLRECQARQLVEVLGLSESDRSNELRYRLTGAGRDWAQNAFEQNAYIGPTPVPLEAYVARIQAQAIGTERIAPDAVRKALGDLLMAEALISQIGPAINSGHSMLLYGPPGNGKSSVAECIGRIFSDTIYVPYCFQVSGQIVKIFDPSVHKAVSQSEEPSAHGLSIVREDVDRRWVACNRPFIITGGELTLEMLDLSFNALARYYEAPLHVKALNGVFLIDDFGRQIITPEALLNHWIVPLASRVDYLKLHTGKSFSFPFDELVIFSTNLAPSQLMDPAFLRRIPYKIEVGAPSMEDYHQIFQRVARKRGVTVPDGAVARIIEELTEKNSFPLAGYQPGFIVDQVCAACKYEGREPSLALEFIEPALANLFTKDSAGFGMVRQKT